MLVEFELSNAQVRSVAEQAAAILSERQAMTTPWLDTKRAAAYLACSAGRIHDLVQLGKLEPRRDGRRLLFHRDNLDAYLNGR